MQLSGQQHIPAPRQQVWESLNDPRILEASIPGCQSVEKLSDDLFAATVVARVGPITATFKGLVTLSEVDPPAGYVITGEGQGGVAGFGKGGARVRLADDGGATVLHYEATGQLGGKLAQVGSRLVDAAAAAMAKEFFERFNRNVSALAAAAPPPRAPAEPPSMLLWMGAACLAVLFVVALAVMN